MKKNWVWILVVLVVIALVLFSPLVSFIRMQINEESFKGNKELFEGEGHRYYTDGEYVYYQNRYLIPGFSGGGDVPLFKRLEGADLESFDPLPEGYPYDYAKDRNNVYYKYNIFEGKL